jgi:integrase
MRLTDISIRTLSPPEHGQRTYFDDTLAGFGCRVSQGGTRSFVLQHGPTRQLITIGRFPIISLAQARTEAKRLLAERTLGKHQPKKISWDDALALFLDHVAQKNKPRTFADYKRLLGLHFKFGPTKLAAITPSDIHRRLDKLSATPSERSHALRAIKIFFNWSKPRYVDRSPCDGMAVVKGVPRRRRLSDSELVMVWRAADEDIHFHKIIRLCILLGQRRSEIGLLRGEYVNRQERTITLPPEIVKNNREHTIPYGTMADKIIEALPEKGFFFPGRYTDTKSFVGWAAGKRELDTKIKGNAPTTPVAPWTLHDLRRTCSTNWASLKIAPHVIDKLLNHVTGSVQGGGISEIAAIYNRHAYMPEMREAIEKWEAYLVALLAKGPIMS